MKLGEFFSRKGNSGKVKMKIGETEIETAAQILREYKAAKVSLEEQIVGNINLFFKFIPFHSIILLCNSYSFRTY